MSTNKPSHRLVSITGDGKQAKFTEIAALWATKNGGLTGDIPAGVTLSGRIGIFAINSKADGAGGAQ